jgi:hypothetical protein
VLLALLLGTAMVRSGQAADLPGPTAGSANLAAGDVTAAAPASTPSAMVELINRLAQSGVLTKQDSADLLLLAEADAADVRAQAALTQAALAQAAAAQARARAYAALLRAATAKAATSARIENQNEDMGGTPMPRGTGVPLVDLSERAKPETRSQATTAAPAVTQAQSPSAPVAVPPQVNVPAPVVAATTIAVERTLAASPILQSAAQNPQAGSPGEVKRSLPSDSMPAPAAEPVRQAQGEESVPDDTVRVTYVPEVVKQQLREEVKQDVLDEARKEGWATPHAVPGWVTKFRLFGDLRTRYEGFQYPAGNDNTGAFPNFNAINTGAPFDVSLISNPLFSPQINVDQDRTRVRLRTRVGAQVDLDGGFAAGLRIATGESNSPVTENQSFGLAGSGQGGNFSKYAIWLDRGFLRYELGGMPDRDLTVSVGRFDNPFFATSMIWADDLGFDGLAMQGKFPVGEDVTPFFSLGAFPVFNTDLNFASNSPAKFKSNDKWLYAAQLGTSLDLGKDFGFKIGAAYYLFRNIEGRISRPFSPINASDPGDTDSSRPAFAQKGNTYMALRDILPDTTINSNGTTNLFQYFGLASKFRELAVDAQLDFNQFEPVQISLVGEYVKNQAFDRRAIAAIAVNNRGAASTTSPSGPFLGDGTAWFARLVLGAAVLQERWDWNLNLGYRKVGSDAVVDGFCDSDFGGGGTNIKGVTVGTNLALSRDVWFGVRWMSATQVAGPTFKNDIIQLDLNGKF